jgi:hypothetical protein
MDSAEQILNSVIYFLSVYVGFFVCITGLIGNLFNVLVFTQLKLFRRNQSAFYLTIASIFDCYLLIFSIAARAIANVSGFDLSRTSIVWCKLRIYLIQIGSITSVATVCFSAIDQYLSTSHDNQLRQMSTLKLAHCLIVTFTIFTVLYSISFPVFYEIRSTSGCSIYNSVFNYYYSFVHLCILLGLVPVIISSLFSLFAYQNVRCIVRRQMPIVRRRLDRQLTAMILLRVALLILTTLPYVSVRMYRILNPVDQNNTFAVTMDQLITFASTIIYAVNFSVK